MEPSSVKQFLQQSLLVLFGTLSAFAQEVPCTHTISGRILDSDTKEPVPFATIRIVGNDAYTSSDTEGYFKIAGLCSDKNTLIISCVGLGILKKQYVTLRVRNHLLGIHFKVNVKEQMIIGYNRQGGGLQKG